jgi:hypothetical protein
MTSQEDLDNDQIGYQLLNSMEKFENPYPEMAQTCQNDMPEVPSESNYDCYSNKDTK